LMACDNSGVDDVQKKFEEGSLKILTIGIPEAPGLLDPHDFHSSIIASTMVFDTLVTVAHDGSIIPKLAEKWNQSVDGKVWTFTLRPYLHFHDGTPCNADSVVFSLNRFNKRFKNRFMDIGIERVEKKDKRTVQIVLKEKFGPFLQYLSLPYISSIISPTSVEPKGDIQGRWIRPIGTGPFKFSKYIKGRKLILYRNANYWLKKPCLDRIILNVIPDPQSRVFALQAGEIDLIYFNWDFHGAMNLSFPERLKRFKILSGPGSITKILQMNSYRKPFSEIKARLALAYAINHTELAELLGEQVSPANSGFFPLWMTEKFDLKPMVYPYDLKKAVHLTHGIEFSPIIFLVNSQFPGDRLIAEYLQSKLQNLGFDIKIQRLESSLYWQAIKNKEFDLALNVTLGVHYDPFGTFSFGLEKRKDRDPAYLYDPEISKNVKNLYQAIDRNIQGELIKKIYYAMYRKVVCIPLLYEKQYSIMSSQVEGFTFGAYGSSIPWYNIHLQGHR